MKKLFFLLLLISAGSHAQIVNIPDANFKAKLLASATTNEIAQNSSSQNMVIDINSDGEIQQNEAILVSKLNVSNSSIANLSGIEAFTSLNKLDCSGNALTSLNVAALTVLDNLNCSSNAISSLYIDNVALFILECSDNLLTSLDFTNCHFLSYLDCKNNFLSDLDLSQVVVDCIDCSNNQLISVNMKNSGLDDFLDCFGNFSANPNLSYICVDEFEIAERLSFFQSQGYPNIEVNTYCSFTPGIDYNTITGLALFDTGGNGCGSEDIHDNFIKINVSDGNNSDATFSTANGTYNFYTGTGNFTVTPQLEIPEWFNSSPANASVNFPANDNLVSVNDFCLTPNGNKRDVEIVVSSFGPPIPGSDIIYKIVFRNKGNQTLSGNLVFNYDETLLAYVETQPFPSEAPPGTFIYNYSDLLPFENRSLLAILHVNETAVNVNDVLTCSAVVGPIAGDENPEDNTYNLQQVVVDSFERNNIICSEGSQENPVNIGKYLHYMINFENTGTAVIQNIVVKDSIDTSKFDINSLQVMNGSHNVDVTVRGNIVEFVYKNINLPSGISNPIGGHGNVLFKIKTLPTLSAGDIATNSASIYFDYNSPIVTNQARTTFNILKRQGFVTDNSIDIHPNPIKNIVNVKANSTIKSLQLFDSLGRILQATTEYKATTSLDISDKPKGIYFLKITTEKGNKVEKLVKE